MEDDALAIVSDEEEKFQPLKKKRSVRLATGSIDQTTATE